MFRLIVEEHQTLRVWQRSTTSQVGRTKRARLLLLLADGLPMVEVARRGGLTRRFVYR